MRCVGTTKKSYLSHIPGFNVKMCQNILRSQLAKRLRLLHSLQYDFLLISMTPICSYPVGLVNSNTLCNSFFINFFEYLSFTFRAFVKFTKLNYYLVLWEWQKMTVPKIFQKTHKKYKNKIAFIMDDKKLTFNDVEELSNQIGGLFKSKNFQKGDTISLLMENRPEYPCIWLGLSKIGVITALINTNLRKETLLHSIKVANSKAIIVSDELSAGNTYL